MRGGLASRESSYGGGVRPGGRSYCYSGDGRVGLNEGGGGGGTTGGGVGGGGRGGAVTSSLPSIGSFAGGTSTPRDTPGGVNVNAGRTSQQDHLRSFATAGDGEEVDADAAYGTRTMMRGRGGGGGGEAAVPVTTEEEDEAAMATRAGEAMQSESRLFGGGPALADADVLEDDEDGAISKIMKVRFARQKLDAPPPLPKGKLQDNEKKLLTKLFNKRAGKATSVFDLVTQAADKEKLDLSSLKSMSKKVNDAAKFTMMLRTENSMRLQALENPTSSKRMLSKMERHLEKVDSEADALNLESMSEEERRQERVKSKLVRGVAEKSLLTAEDQKIAVDGVQQQRQEGAVSLDLAIENNRVHSPVFHWRPMERVTLATELPLELFENAEEEVDRHVLLAEAAIRQKDVKSMPTVAEMAAPTGGAEWRTLHGNAQGTVQVGKGVKSAAPALEEGAAGGDSQELDDERGVEAALMEERAKELAKRRRDAALELSRKYDFNVAAAVKKANRYQAEGDNDEAGMKLGGGARPPMSHGLNTMPRPTSDRAAAAKARAQHYNRWFLPAAQLSLDEYNRKKMDYSEKLGGEQSRIQRQLREKQRELEDSLAPLHSARLYKTWLTGNPDVSRMPHYMKKVPVQRERTRAKLNLEKMRDSGNFTDAQTEEGKKRRDAAAAEKENSMNDFMRRRSSYTSDDGEVDPFMMGGGISMKV